jgi:hypothetical protein
MAALVVLWSAEGVDVVLGIDAQNEAAQIALQDHLRAGRAVVEFADFVVTASGLATLLVQEPVLSLQPVEYGRSVYSDLPHFSALGYEHLCACSFSERPDFGLGATSSRSWTFSLQVNTGFVALTEVTKEG